MATLAELRTDLRTRFVDKDGRFLTDDDCDLYINLAYHDFANRAESNRREWAFNVTANQYSYDVPTDMIKPGTMMWMKDSRRPLEFRQLSFFADNGGLDLTSFGPPNFYTFHQGDSGLTAQPQFRLWPTPSSSSEQTTNTGLIGSGDTQILVTDSSKFRARGWVLINAELILFYSKDDSTNTLKQCVRGMGGTKAANHLVGQDVIQQDVHIWYYYQPADLSTGTSVPEIPLPYHDLLVTGALYQGLKADGRMQEAGVAFQEWGQGIAFAKGEMLKAQTSNFITINLPGGYD